MKQARTTHTYTLLSFLWASLMLASCAADDLAPADGSRRAIVFDAADRQEAVTSRAASTPLADFGINQITVYGYKTLGGTLQNVMPGYTLQYTANSAKTSLTNATGWEYVGKGKDYLGYGQEIKYWDGNSTDYRFFGVIPSSSTSSSGSTLKYKASASATAADITTSTQATTDGSFVLSFSGLEYMIRKQTTSGTTAYYESDGTTEVQESAIPIYGHLWQGDPAANSSQPVTLAFVKPYALIRLVFMRPEGTSTTQLGDPTGTDNTKDITFAPISGNIAGSGNLTITYPMTGSEESYEVTSGSTSTLTGMKLGTLELTQQDVQYQAWPEYVMLPTNSGSNPAFKCTAYIYNEGSYELRTATVPAAYMQWRPGYQYTYIFKITSTNTLEFSHVLEVYTKWQAGYVQETTW